jgi:hypothetical protein
MQTAVVVDDRVVARIVVESDQDPRAAQVTETIAGPHLLGAFLGDCPVAHCVDEGIAIATLLVVGVDRPDE